MSINCEVECLYCHQPVTAGQVIPSEAGSICHDDCYKVAHEQDYGDLEDDTITEAEK